MLVKTDSGNNLCQFFTTGLDQPGHAIKDFKMSENRLFRQICSASLRGR